MGTDWYYQPADEAVADDELEPWSPECPECDGDTFDLTVCSGGWGLFCRSCGLRVPGH